MKNLFWSLFFLLTGVVTVNAQNTFTSGILFDNPSFSYLTESRLIQLADGSYLTAGNPPTSPDRFYLTHYDNFGTPLWQKRINVNAVSCVITPLSDSGFLFMTNRISGISLSTNFILSRFDKNGNIIVQHSYFYPGHLWEAEIFEVTDSEFVLCGRASQYTTQQSPYNQGAVFWKFDGSCNFISQRYMRPAYAYSQFLIGDAKWQFARDSSGGYIVCGNFFSASPPDGVLMFRTDSAFNPSTGMYYDNATTNIRVRDIQSDNSGGYWFIGETDSIVSYYYYHQMLTLMHFNSSNQLISSKRYYSLDSAAQYNQCFSALDPTTGKIYVTRTLSFLIYPIAQPLQIAALDSVGELITAGSLNAAETGGIIVSDHQPVMVCRATENFWSRFTLLSRMDTSSLISCFDLGNPLSGSRPFTPPVANSIAINVLADSLLTPTTESISVAITTYPVAINYCLTAGANQTNSTDANEVFVTQQDDQLNIQYSATLPSATCSLYDVQGNVILENVITNTYSMNTSTIANGVYILRIDWGGQSNWCRKIVITH